MAKRIAKFYKVSYEQFKKDFLDCFTTEDMKGLGILPQGFNEPDSTAVENAIKKIYCGIELPKRGTEKSAGYDSGRSAGSGKCGNYSPYRRGCRSKRSSSDKDLRGYHKPEGYTINHGFCLQNAFPICGKCGIISTGTERQKYPHICGASAW